MIKNIKNGFMMVLCYLSLWAVYIYNAHRFENNKGTTIDQAFAPLQVTILFVTQVLIAVFSIILISLFIVMPLVRGILIPVWTRFSK